MNVAELEEKLADPMWRLCNLYKIMIKGDQEQKAGEAPANLVVTFQPNRAQRRLLKRLWHRNIILKARQLGFTTLICLLFLDYALFTPNVRCGIIAQDREAAETIFRDKVKFAYENLPPELLERFPLKRDSATELLFAHNNSSIRVATSMRSGTIHRLHVSEFGKICAKFPDKAKEVITGSIPAVPKTGMLFIESTAEGQEGEFYDMCQQAEALADASKPLTVRDYRFHFFPWWDEPNYVLPVDGVVITDKDREYFEQIEAEIGRSLTPEQRAWYVATRDADFRNNPERMWQEFPSTPAEAFQKSTEGCYYVNQFKVLRKHNRITTVPHLPNVPVNTFWDIGGNDETAIWFHQQVGPEHRFIRYYEASGEGFSHFVRYMQDQGYVWGRHFLPHDATHKRQLGQTNKSAQDMLAELGLQHIEIVPRIPEIITGINQTRDAFAACVFDKEHCKDGLVHLELYRKQWDDRHSCWRDHPRHDVHSNGADAFRQFAQSIDQLRGSTGGNRRRQSRNWRMA